MAKKRKRGRKTLDREEARRLQRVRAARAAHKKIRGSGRVPGEEARAAAAANRKLRREWEEKEKANTDAGLPRWEGRVGRANVDGV